MALAARFHVLFMRAALFAALAGAARLLVSASGGAREPLIYSSGRSLWMTDLRQ